MQAAVVPAVNSSWQVKEVPQPQPEPNQVLVKMHASGICYTDVHQTLGHIPGSFPRILGHEPVGEIVAVAPDVTHQVATLGNLNSSPSRWRQRLGRNARKAGLSNIPEPSAFAMITIS